MSEWSRIKSKNRRNLIYVLIFFFIILIIYIPKYILTVSPTINPEETVYSTSIKVKGVILLNDINYYASQGGIVKQYVEEGEKVKAKTKIMDINPVDDNTEIKGQLDLIDKAIQNKTTNSSSDLDAQFKSLISEFQYYSLSQNKHEAYDLTEKIIMSYTTQIQNDIYNELSIQELEQKRSEILTNISTNGNDYLSSTSGIVSFYDDGLNDTYTMKNYLNLLPDDLDFTNYISKIISTPRIVENKQYIFKVIDNFKWYYAFVDDTINFIDSIETGMPVNIKISDKKLNAVIIRIDKFENKTLIVVSCVDFLENIYKDRVLESEVTFSSKPAYRIPENAIIEKQDAKGVLVKELNGIVKYRPIYIIGYKDGYAYIDKGDMSSYINIGDRKVKTVTRYEDVFVNPKQVREGQIID